MNSRQIEIQEFQAKREGREKNSHSNKPKTEHQGPVQGLVFLILLGASLKKNVNPKPQEGQKNPNTPLHIGASRKGYSARTSKS